MSRNASNSLLNDKLPLSLGVEPDILLGSSESLPVNRKLYSIQGGPTYSLGAPNRYLSIENYTQYKGASPRRADARLGSAHARHGRGCRQIEAVGATVPPSSALKLSCLGEEKKALGHGMQWTSTNFAARENVRTCKSIT